MSEQQDPENFGIGGLPNARSRVGPSAKRMAIGLLIGIPAAVGVAVIVVVGIVLSQKQNASPTLSVATVATTSSARHVPGPPEAAPTPRSEDQAVQFTLAARRLNALEGNALSRELWAFEQSADPVTYAMMKRNADRFRGRRAVFSGRVLEIQDTQDGGSFIRLGMSEYGDEVLAVMTVVQPSENIVERSRVRVYGILSGSYTYQSQAGWTITIPSMVAVSVVASSTPRHP